MPEVFKVSTFASDQVRDRKGGPVICVIGVGYVGLPLAHAFDRGGFEVIAYDIDDERIGSLQDGRDPTDELGDVAIAESDIEFTSKATVVERSEYVLVSVPTPIDDRQNPDLKYVRAAGKTIGEHITSGTTVILESTVYPGATREVLAPAIEERSGLTVGDEFSVAYSPERLVPGDEEHTLSNVVKVVGADSDDVLADVAELYDSVVEAGVHRAPSIEVAEAAKCVENVQRDLNIALVNELALACDSLGLDTHDVLEAAGTKWNFHEYMPGLVGGHCIPVDPFFMIYGSERNGFTPKLVEMGREVNEYMPEHVAELTLRGLNDCGKVLRESRVLVLGLAYKAGVADIRTSQIGGTIQKLESYGIDVVGYDPHADQDASESAFDIPVQSTPSFEGFDGVILATPHEELLELDFVSAAEQMAEDPLLVDVMGQLNGVLADHEDIAYRRL